MLQKISESLESSRTTGTFRGHIYKCLGTILSVLYQHHLLDDLRINLNNNQSSLSHPNHRPTDYDNNNNMEVEDSEGNQLLTCNTLVLFGKTSNRNNLLSSTEVSFQAEEIIKIKQIHRKLLDYVHVSLSNGFRDGDKIDAPAMAGAFSCLSQIMSYGARND